MLEGRPGIGKVPLLPRFFQGGWNPALTPVITITVKLNYNPINQLKSIPNGASFPQVIDAGLGHLILLGSVVAFSPKREEIGGVEKFPLLVILEVIIIPKY